MKTLHPFNRIMLALVCAALTVAASPANAKAGPPVRITPFTANAGVGAALTPTADPAVFKASATGVVQSLILGTLIETAALEVRFPATPDQPAIVNGIMTLTSINGLDSLQITVTGTATPDLLNPGFYNAKYQITITGGTGAYASARGLAEIDEVIMFTSATTATATWNTRGFVVMSR